MTSSDAKTAPAAIEPAPAPAGQSGDVLLWVAAAVVAVIGAAWLWMLHPWRDDALGAAPAASTAAPTEPASESAGADPATTATRLDSGLENPLRTAELALEAGMLVEPERHSAWALFSSVLEQDPGNEAALTGRARVADRLVARADTALEQGRIDDARAAAELVLGAIEDHDGATRLMERIEAATRPPPPEPARVEAPPEQAPAEPPPDPNEVALTSAREAFERAMAAARLLAPADASASHFVDVMVGIDPEDERTVNAREQLFEALLARSESAVRALDAVAARTWINAADRLGVDPDAVEGARTRLVDALVARESARPVPLSSLELTNYVPPAYPYVATRRELEGWVDIEFTVTREGATSDITVVDASDENLFRDETVAAVEQWRFVPRVFMDRRIEQRAYTRVRFELD